jgi:hypothetical protein
MTQSPMIEAVAHVAIETPRRYLTQLCQHFEHRLDVAYHDDRGSILSPAGTCLLDSSTGQLVLRARAEDAEKLALIEDVVSRHLLRFAFRDPPDITWQREAG